MWDNHRNDVSHKLYKPTLEILPSKLTNAVLKEVWSDIKMGGLIVCEFYARQGISFQCL